MTYDLDFQFQTGKRFDPYTNKISSSEARQFKR